MAIKLTIPVSGSFHKKLGTLIKWLGYIAYFGLIGTTVVLDVQKYLSANRIKSDMTVVDAVLTLDKIVEESGSKGRTYDVYHFNYQFEVNGEAYTGNMSVAERNLEGTVEGDTIKIGYNNSKPQEFERLDKIEQFDSIWDIVKHLFTVIIVAAIVIFVVCAYILFGLFKNKDEKDEDEDLEGEASAAQKS